MTWWSVENLFKLCFRPHVQDHKVVFFLKPQSFFRIHTPYLQHMNHPWLIQYLSKLKQKIIYCCVPTFFCSRTALLVFHSSSANLSKRWEARNKLRVGRFKRLKFKLMCKHLWSVIILELVYLVIWLVLWLHSEFSGPVGRSVMTILALWILLIWLWASCKNYDHV